MITHQTKIHHKDIPATRNITAARRERNGNITMATPTVVGPWKVSVFILEKIRCRINRHIHPPDRNHTHLIKNKIARPTLLIKNNLGKYIPSFIFSLCRK